MRLRLAGILATSGLLAVCDASLAPAQILNNVCTFRPGNDALRKKDLQRWVEQGLAGCKVEEGHVPVVVIPAPDPLLESWTESMVAALVCDFGKTIAVLPARSMHAASSHAQVHTVEASAVIVCALQRGNGP